MQDPFQPSRKPARLIYAAILAAAKKRAGVMPVVWVAAERENVWQVARDYAQQHGLQVPTIDAIMRVAQAACGHVDYAAKWACGVSECLTYE